MTMPYPKPVFTTTVVDENGSIVASPTVAVYDQLSGALYPIYSVPTWASKSNPFTGGADGLVQFAVVGGNEQVFKIVITKGAFSKTLEYVMLGNASMHSVNRSTGTPSNADLLRYYDLNRLFVSKANNNLTAVTDPTVNDDSADGYTKGSKWLNTASSPLEIFECLDATVGAAVWANTTLTIGELGTSALVDMGTGGNQIRTNTQNEAFFEAIHVNNYVATADPDVTNDVNEGYLVGSEWLNTASSPMELFFCLDNTAGAAVWRSSMAVDQDFGTMANLDAGTGASEFRTNAQNEAFFQPITVERTVDPTANDDENDGFIVGSVWINTTDSPPSIFTAVDVTATAAVWRQQANDIFDPTAAETITGPWRFDLVNNGWQCLTTDDPTLAAATHLFGISYNLDPNYTIDYRLISFGTAGFTGYYSYRQLVTGEQAAVLTADDGIGGAVISVLANGSGGTEANIEAEILIIEADVLNIQVAYLSDTVSSSSGIVTIDMSTAKKLIILTLTENVTSWVFNNLPASGYKEIEIKVIQHASAAKTVVSPATSGKTAGGAWTASATLSSEEVLGLRVYSTGTIEMYPSGVLA